MSDDNTPKARGRPHKIPDVNDRSPNEPSIVLSSQKVLGIAKTYGIADPENIKVTRKITHGVAEMSVSEGWAAEVVGTQIVLTNEKVGELYTPPNDDDDEK